MKRLSSTAATLLLVCAVALSCGENETSVETAPLEPISPYSQDEYESRSLVLADWKKPGDRALMGIFVHGLTVMSFALNADLERLPDLEETYANSFMASDISSTLGFYYTAQFPLKFGATGYLDVDNGFLLPEGGTTLDLLKVTGWLRPFGQVVTVASERYEPIKTLIRKGIFDPLTHGIYLPTGSSLEEYLGVPAAARLEVNATATTQAGTDIRFFTAAEGVMFDLPKEIVEEILRVE